MHSPKSCRVNRRGFLVHGAVGAGAFAAGFAAPTVLRAADAWGDLVGRFVYDGDPPERRKLTVDRDVAYCAQFDIRDESLMVSKDRGLMNVYVYCRDRRIKVCPELEETADEQVLLDNRNCILVPHCMKIWYTHQELKIRNSESIAENVAFSPLGDRPANIVLPAPPAEGSTATWRFGRPQRVPVPIICNYHPWEIAYILPLDHPHVDISARDGTFRIEKLPVGTREFQVWHERTGYLNTRQWTRGRFQMEIRPGVNNLGTIRLAPELFEPSSGNANAADSPE